MRTIRLAAATAAVLAMRGVAAAILCSTITAPPGAIYLYGDAPMLDSFLGNSFAIDGRDHTLAGGAGSAPPILGIATSTEANAQEARDSLVSSQRDNVQGLGYDPTPPITPSIGAVATPDAATLDQLVNGILSAPHVMSSVQFVTGNMVIGTREAPQITHFTGSLTIKGSGILQGFGVLIVDGSLTVQGTLQYGGLIMVRGPLNVSGLSTILGSVWAHTASLTVGGASIMYYSSEGLGEAMAAGAFVACVVPVCGDGVLTEGEQCDDGNTSSGDCCSATCTLESAASPCADDGNDCTIDRCDGAGVCVHPNSGAACDDGDACPSNDTCVAAACVGTPVTCGSCMQCDTIAGCVPSGAPGCVCGDGIVVEGEACDDGNILDGDCCSSACTFEPTTSPCADDGNACTDDRCDGAGTCVHPSNGVSCDDGDACTSDDTCVASACAGTPVDCGPCMQCDAGDCVTAPALDCREPLVPSVSRLALTDSEDPRRDRLAWKWRTSDGLARSDLGDPLVATGYTLCLFGGPDAGSILVRAAVPAGSGCGPSCGWTATTRGFKYRDRLASTGVGRIDLVGRQPGVGKIKVSGAGDALRVPALPFPLAAPLVMQLRAGDGACWQTTYPIENVGFGSGRLSARGAAQ
jgi:cysteine-rich repeat protein